MALKSLREFTAESNAFDRRFKALADAEQADRGAALEEEVVEWLGACARHGRYLPADSVDRQALQGILDYWGSTLLQRGRVPPDDCEELYEHDADAGIALTVDCPYPGLDPYDYDYRAIFFGRQDQIETYVAHLEERRILLVTGASGSGKSSLALAGVLPVLEERHAGAWLFPAPFTPGASPLRALARSLADALGNLDAAAGIEQALSARPSAALAVVAEHCGERSPMFVVDQLEELFTVCRSAAQRERFAGVLLALSAPEEAAGTCRPRVLLTLRTDHLARVERDKALYTRLVLEKNQYPIGGLEAPDIRRAIAEPAARVGLRFPAPLVERLANETAGLPNGLPLLQFALRWLWDHRPTDADGNPKDLVTEQMVRDLPSVKKALGTVANGVYARFTDVQKRVCRRLLQELIVLDESFEEPLRRRRREAELVTVLQRRFPGTPDDVGRVIDAFVTAGLVRRFGAGDDRQLEVAHEALLRHWQEFSDLLDVRDVKERLNRIKLVGREAADWIAQGRSESYLKLRGDGLESACKLAADGWLEEAASAEYVHACQALEARALAEKQQAADEARRAREAREAARESELREAKAEARAQRLAKQRIRWGFVGFAVVVSLLVRTGYGIYERTQTNTANLTAYSSIASSLPPWDDLDVAFTLASEFGTPFRFALARALERMEDTTLVGDRRKLKLLPNDDGSALLQLHRAEQALRVFLVSGSHVVDETPLTIPLGGRMDRLSTAKVGPKIGEDRLALLVFRGEEGKPGLSIETYRISASGNSGPAIEGAGEPLELEEAGDVLGVSFDPRRLRAALVTVVASPGQTRSRIVELGVEPRVDRIDVDAPSASLPPVSAVAYLGDEFVFGHMDGSVTCPGGGNRNPLKELGARSDRILQFAGLTGGSLLAALSRDAVFVMDCQGAEFQRLDNPASGAASLMLMSQAHHGAGEALLSVIVGREQRCLRRDATGRWHAHPCNSQRRVAHAFPRMIGSGGGVAPRQLTIEESSIAAVHVHPMEVPMRAQVRSEGRWAGETIVRWQRLGGGNTQADEDHPPWKRGEDGVVEPVSAANAILQVALARDGKHLTWVEWDGVRDRGGTPQPQFRLRAAQVDTLARMSTDETLNYQPAALAVSVAGTVAQVSPPKPSTDTPGAVDSPALWVDGNRLDELPPGPGSAVTCLAFSAPKGERLVLATRDTGVRVWHRSAGGWKPDWQGWRSPFARQGADDADQARSEPTTRAITACDVADDGELAVGASDGSVARVLGSGDRQELTQRVAFQLSASVKEIAIESMSGRRHVLVLGDWQSSNCSRRVLPGHAVSVWDTATLDEDDSRSPVASACFPNQPVLALGGLLPGEGSTPPGIRLLTATGTKVHECSGCAIGDESPDEMLARLLHTAENRERATPLDPEVMERRYGLRF